MLTRLSTKHDGCVDDVCGAFDATELLSGTCSLIVKDLYLDFIRRQETRKPHLSPPVSSYLPHYPRGYCQ